MENTTSTENINLGRFIKNMLSASVAQNEMPLPSLFWAEIRSELLRPASIASRCFPAMFDDCAEWPVAETPAGRINVIANKFVFVVCLPKKTLTDADETFNVSKLLRGSASWQFEYDVLYGEGTHAAAGIVSADATVRTRMPVPSRDKLEEMRSKLKPDAKPTWLANPRAYRRICRSEPGLCVGDGKEHKLLGMPLLVREQVREGSLVLACLGDYLIALGENASVACDAVPMVRIVMRYDGKPMVDRCICVVAEGIETEAANA